MIQYFIDEKKKTVVAKFERKFVYNDQEMWVEYLVTHIRKVAKKSNNFFKRPFGDGISIYKLVTDIVKQNDSYYGMAQCSGDDTFDVEKGKELAKKRLLKKYYDTQADVMNKISNIMDKVARDFSSDFYASIDKTRKFKNEINSFKK